MSKLRNLVRTRALSRPKRDHVIIGIGLFLVLWRIHAFVLPFQLRPVENPSSWFEKLFDWSSPWRWRRGDLLTNSTPTGGDMGAHVWTPDVLRRSMFPHGRITGWSDDWFAGVPVLRFYFPLPIVSIALLSYVLPYGLAFKLVTIAGLVSLPIVSYRFGRIVGFAEPTPLFLALSAFVYLFGRWYDVFIYGGGILSTMAGEFSFSVSLSLAVLFLGLYVRLLRDGIGPRRTAIVLAATGLSHLLPTLWVLTFALVVTLISMSRGDWAVVLRRASRVAATAALLGAWWIVPFAASLPYTNDMGWEKATRYREFLFPFLATKRPADAQIVALACVGVVFAVARRLWSRAVRRLVHKASVDGQTSVGGKTSVDGVTIPDDRFAMTEIVTWSLAIVGGLAGLLFRFSPQHRLWNTRILPFWFLMVVFVGAIGWSEVRRRSVARRVAAGAFATFVSVGLPLGLVPDWVPVPKLGDGIVGLQRASTAAHGHLATGWTKNNFSGYEAQPGWPEYRALMDTASRVGAKHGCGRVMWEHEEVRFATYGTTLSLMLFPYWTKGCMGSIDGVYFESSATLPQHWITAALVSAPKSDDAANGRIYSGPTNPQRNLPYPSFDLARAVPLLRSAGVRYFLSVTPETTEIAHRMTRDFAQVATSGPYTFFRVLDSELVRSLSTEPVVLRGIGQSQDGGWLDVGAAANSNPDRFPEVMVASGPSTWQRARVRVERLGSVRVFGSGTSIAPTRPRPLEPVRVSSIRSTGTALSFEVDRVGIPVAVNTSYMPNWQARGARGPYRSQSNFMVVVPTSTRVVLTYGSTTSETAGRFLTMAGLALLVPWRRLTRARNRLRT